MMDRLETDTVGNMFYKHKITNLWFMVMCCRIRASSIKISR